MSDSVSICFDDRARLPLSRQRPCRETLSPAFWGCGGSSWSIPCWGVPQTGQASTLRLIFAPQHGQKAAIESPRRIFDACREHNDSIGKSIDCE